MFGRLFEQRNRARHASARVEHHDDTDGLDDILEIDDGLWLVVIVDFEIILREIRYEASLSVGNRDEKRDNLSPRLERWFLRKKRG